MRLISDEQVQALAQIAEESKSCARAAALQSCSHVQRLIGNLNCIQDGLQKLYIEMTGHDPLVEKP